MSNPQILQSIMGMAGSLNQQAMGGASQGLSNPGGFPGSFGAMDPQLTNILSGMQQANSQVAPQTVQQTPEVRYQVQLAQLSDMGFFNPSENVMALEMTGGDVQMAIEWLFNRPRI